MRLDQDGIEAWLLQLVLNYDPPDEDILANVPAAFTQYLPGAATKDTTIPSASAQAKIPRVDLYQKLVDNYEAQRLRWIAFKTNARPDQTSSAATVDEYNRKMLSAPCSVFQALTDFRYASFICDGGGQEARSTVDCALSPWPM